MSDSDSFIEEVSEEVRKDRLYGYLKRYGWIGAAAVFAIVGGAAWNEYSKAQDRAQAQTLGDAMLAALEQSDADARISGLSAIETDNAGGQAVLALLAAAQEAAAGDPAAATSRLEAIATNNELPLIYRQIASYKALLAGSETLDADTRRAGFTALAAPGNPLRLLAEEQLMLIDLDAGDTEAAIEKATRIAEDAEASAGQRSRAAQMITALGGSAPDV